MGSLNPIHSLTHSLTDAYESLLEAGKASSHIHQKKSYVIRRVRGSQIQ